MDDQHQPNVNGEESLAHSKRFDAILKYFKLTKSWDDDDEEDLTVMIIVNGEELYARSNQNCEVNTKYGKGKRVSIVGDTADLYGAVKCTDYHKPFYGDDRKIDIATNGTYVLSASKGNGGWTAEIEIVFR